MIDKWTISHELGHAVTGRVLDLYWVPTYIELTPYKTDVAMCMGNEYTKKKKFKYVVPEIKGISNLGGIFGELIDNGGWRAWHSRWDISIFLLENKNTAQDIVLELDNWYYVDDDFLSFKECSKLGHENQDGRAKFTLNYYDVCTRLPYVWDVYILLIDLIDANEFKKIVDEIYSSKITKITPAKLKSYLDRIVL